MEWEHNTSWWEFQHWQIYISILDDNLWPVVAQHFGNRPWIFQEDNAPCHVSVSANEWKRDNSIGTLPWPTRVQTSTLSKMFGKLILKNRVHRRYLRLKTPMIWNALCKKFGLLCLSTTYRVWMPVFPKDLEYHTCPRPNIKILEEKVTVVYC